MGGDEDEDEEMTMKETHLAAELTWHLAMLLSATVSAYAV
jgi:hypothetical protein